MSRETELTRMILQNWKRQFGQTFFYFKVPDPQFGYATGCRAVDVLGCFRGVMCAFEFKRLQRDRSSIKLTAIRAEQIATLEAIEAAGGVAAFIIVRETGPTEKEAVYICLETMKALLEEAQKMKKISITWELLCETGGMLIRHRRGSYIDWTYAPFITHFTNKTRIQVTSR